MKAIDNKWVDLSNGVAWAIIFSLAAIIMGIIALSTRYPRTDLSMDYMGIIVGILSLLVTTLIGWQIFNLIKIDRLKENLEDANSKLEALKNDAQKELYKHYAESMLLHAKDYIQHSKSDKIDCKQLKFAYSLTASALHYHLLANESGLIDSCLDIFKVCLGAASAQDKWHELFDEETESQIQGCYIEILKCIISMSESQIDLLNAIHESRKNKRLHSSLR